MSVFAEKAAALQRQQAAEQKRAEEEKAAIESKLVALESEAADFLHKLAEQLGAERSARRSWDSSRTSQVCVRPFLLLKLA